MTPAGTRNTHTHTHTHTHTYTNTHIPGGPAGAGPGAPHRSEEAGQNLPAHCSFASVAGLFSSLYI